MDLWGKVAETLAADAATSIFTWSIGQIRWVNFFWLFALFFLMAIQPLKISQ